MLQVLVVIRALRVLYKLRIVLTLVISGGHYLWFLAFVSSSTTRPAAEQAGYMALIVRHTK